MNTYNLLLENDCSFYFMYRINKYEWKFLLERQFLINMPTHERNYAIR